MLLELVVAPNLTVCRWLPWRSAKSLLLALLESMAAAATTVLGSSVARALTTPMPLTADDHALVSQVEAGTVARIACRIGE